MSQEQDDETSDNDTMGGRIDPFVLIRVRANRVIACWYELTTTTHTRAFSKMNRAIDKLEDAIADYEGEIARLRADGARLDFMLSLGSIARFSAACSKVKIESTGEQWLHDARRAIDAAMKENYK